MAEKNAVSICIPAYRAKDFIAETLQSALSQTWPVEIFVSVDPADDDTATRVRDELPHHNTRYDLLIGTEHRNTTP